MRSTEELIKRLRDEAEGCSGGLMSAAADEIARLREALKWYAKCAVAGKVSVTTGPAAHAYYERDDGERARQALSHTGGDKVV